MSKKRYFICHIWHRSDEDKDQLEEEQEEEETGEMAAVATTINEVF